MKRRSALAAILLGGLFFFLVPFVPNPNLLACGYPLMCPRYLGGLESLGYLTAHYGATYSLEFGYYAPGLSYLNSVGSSNALATTLLLAFIVAPILAISLVLLRPILNKKRQLAPSKPRPQTYLRGGGQMHGYRVEQQRKPPEVSHCRNVS